MGRILRPEANTVTWKDSDGTTWQGKYFGDPNAEVYVNKDPSGRWVITNRPAGVDPFYSVEPVQDPEPDPSQIVVPQIPENKNWSFKKRLSIGCLILAPATCFICVSAVSFGNRIAMEVIENWPK